MKQRIIHAKQLDSITKVEFSYKDITIYQENALVLLTKDQIIELATLILAEEHDQKYYEDMKKGRIADGKIRQ